MVLAWLAARGVQSIPHQCRQPIDAEYVDGAGPLGSLDLPLIASLGSDVRWEYQGSAQRLFRDKGPGYASNVCGEGCHVDGHASALGMYLNALVFYSTLFRATPVGAALPDGTQVVDGMRMPHVDPQEAKAMQRIAADVVLPHLSVWSPSSTEGAAAGRNPVETAPTSPSRPPSSAADAANSPATTERVEAGGAAEHMAPGPTSVLMVSAVGDLIFERRLQAQAENKGSYSESWRGVIKHLKAPHIMYGNLEGVISTLVAEDRGNGQYDYIDRGERAAVWGSASTTGPSSDVGTHLFFNYRPMLAVTRSCQLWF